VAQQFSDDRQSQFIGRPIRCVCVAQVCSRTPCSRARRRNKSQALCRSWCGFSGSLPAIS
jgi:hypothetical protein